MADSQFIIDVTRDNYQQVMEASFKVPVLIDFWASWCQPCQVLMPVLARLAEEYQGKFLLGKLNTEEEQEIAAQFGIRSIPNVKLFRNGQPVDEFMGALPEGEVRQFLDRHVARESDLQVAAAREQLAAGNVAGAIVLLDEAREADPGNARVTLALAEAQVASGDIAAAEATLDSLPPSERDKPEVASLRSHLYFEGQVAEAPATPELAAKLEANPDAVGIFGFSFLDQNADKIHGAEIDIIPVEPEACPTLTKAPYAYDHGDTAEMTPLMPMHSLGHRFIPPTIHAGGLRYHGMAPLVSASVTHGWSETQRTPRPSTTNFFQ